MEDKELKYFIDKTALTIISSIFGAATILSFSVLGMSHLTVFESLYPLIACFSVFCFSVIVGILIKKSDYKN